VGRKCDQSFVKRTYDIIELISELPNIGTLEHSDKKVRGFLITKHNKFFYRITEKEIIILNFFDTRAKPKAK
jgi:plasmid stabilization system protein ParE